MLFPSLPPSLSPQFPECDDKKAISVSCLDMTYSISFRSHQVKDEKKDLTVAVVLNDLTEEEGSSDKGKLVWSLNAWVYRYGGGNV